MTDAASFGAASNDKRRRKARKKTASRGFDGREKAEFFFFEKRFSCMNLFYTWMFVRPSNQNSLAVRSSVHLS